MKLPLSITKSFIDETDLISNKIDSLISTTTPKTVEEVESCIQNPCFNDGVCKSINNFIYCKCPPSFTGPFCEEMVFESREKLKMTLFASMSSLLFTIIILFLLLTVAYYLWKKSKSDGNKKIFDKELLFIQEQLNKLPYSKNNSRFEKLSKIIEATARAAIITYPELVVPPNPQKKNALLNKTSKISRTISAPSGISSFFHDPFKVERKITKVYYNKPKNKLSDSSLITIEKNDVRRVFSEKY